LFTGCVPFSRVDQRGLERTSLQAGAALEALILIDAVSLILAALNAGGRTVLGADAAVMDSKNVRKVKTVPETPCLQRPVYGRFVKMQCGSDFVPALLCWQVACQGRDID